MPRAGGPPGGDWHRLIHLRRFPTAADFPAFIQCVAEETLIVPTIESDGGLCDLEAIFALEEVQLVWLAAGDISKIFGVPFQYEHPNFPVASYCLERS